MRINDLNLKNWQQHDDILTDSLWIIPERDKSGAHTGEYHGNFIPQIPHQIMRRYTKKSDIILDTFLGSGTTLIEARRLGRNSIGIELVPQIANKAKRIIMKEPSSSKNIFTSLITGDSADSRTKKEVEKALKQHNKKSIQLIIMHPPYHDIIKFSRKPQDLSNKKTLKEFLDSFEEVVKNFYDLLDKGRYVAIVIGDKYANSEWVPLGFHVLNRVMNNGFRLKSLLVKNMVGNRAKRNQEHLWRYRALVGGFYIFKHEYILLFQKK